jgi:hypothetical protein
MDELIDFLSYLFLYWAIVLVYEVRVSCVCTSVAMAMAIYCKPQEQNYQYCIEEPTLYL